MECRQCQTQPDSPKSRQNRRGCVKRAAACKSRSEMKGTAFQSIFMRSWIIHWLLWPVQCKFPFFNWKTGASPVCGDCVRMVEASASYLNCAGHWVASILFDWRLCAVSFRIHSLTNRVGGVRVSTHPLAFPLVGVPYAIRDLPLNYLIQIFIDSFK